MKSALERRVQEKGELLEALLKKWNEAVDLVAPSTIPDFWERHFLDSLKATSIFRGKTIIDFGSGGGFPALPIAISRPDLKVLAVEKVGKKRAFIMEAAGVCGVGCQVSAISDFATAIKTVQAEVEVTVRAVSMADVVRDRGVIAARKERFITFIHWGEDARAVDLAKKGLQSVQSTVEGIQIWRSTP